MNGHDDGDLREAFKALGGAQGASAPNFDQLTSMDAARAARWRQRRRRAALLAAAVIIPTVLVLQRRAERGLDYEQFTALTGLDLGEVSWEAPSDFLLDVPGSELLRGVPDIEIRLPAITPDSTRPTAPNDSQRRSRS
jgi:hypothetical protein